MELELEQRSGLNRVGSEGAYVGYGFRVEVVRDRYSEFGLELVGVMGGYLVRAVGKGLGWGFRVVILLWGLGIESESRGGREGAAGIEFWIWIWSTDPRTFRTNTVGPHVLAFRTCRMSRLS